METRDYLLVLGIVTWLAFVLLDLALAREIKALMKKLNETADDETTAVKGGMTMCHVHGGYGFRSDCRACAMTTPNAQGQRAAEPSAAPQSSTPTED